MATLRFCGGNRRRTASVLGVSVKTIYNKLVGYDPAAGTGAGIGPDAAATARVPSLVRAVAGD